jgi:hypothetical protein
MGVEAAQGWWRCQRGHRPGARYARDVTTSAVPPQHQRSALSVEAGGLIAAGIALLGSVGLLVLLLRTSPVPIQGGDSVSAGSQLMVLLTGLVTVPIVYLRSPRAKKQRVLQRVLSTVILTLTIAFTAAMLVSALFAIFAVALPAVELDIPSAVGIGVVLAALAAYFIVGVVANLATTQVATLLSVFLIGGVLGAMLSATASDWFLHNFSTLGISTPESASSFNSTLVLAGLLVVTLADFVAKDLHDWMGDEFSRRRIAFVRWWLVGSGVAMMGVGLIPLNVNHLAHSILARVMMGLFAVLIIVLPFLVPRLPVTFKIASYAALALIGGVAALMAIGYFNLTVVEFLATVILFVWLTLFVRTVAAGAADQRRHAPSAEVH